MDMNYIFFLLTVCQDLLNLCNFLFEWSKCFDLLYEIVGDLIHS